jgi:enoyl-[acyl-carrier-protein] reductase (NADH)
MIKMKTSSNKGTVQASDRSIKWSIDQLLAGESATLKIRVEANGKITSMTELEKKRYIIHTEVKNDKRII